jgi:DNA-binding transcriptional ArsR family regulator
MLCKAGPMDLPLPAEDALAQPTRAQIFTFLVEHRRPAGTEELAGHFGLHPNGIRRHLERLLEGGFVTRTRIRQGQGRPRDSWAVSPDAHPGGQRPRAYTDLANWLARAIPATPTRLREVERAGREIGRELPLPRRGPREPGRRLRPAPRHHHRHPQRARPKGEADRIRAPRPRAGGVPGRGQDRSNLGE